MPTISMFYGIIIRMYNNGEHNPPHFHALYQGYQAVFDMEGELVDGDMPKRQKKFIAAWAEIHKDELLANWELAMSEQPLYKIDPLKGKDILKNTKLVMYMKNPHWVVETVEPHTDYTLFLTFADGKRKIYNARPLLDKKIYEPLKNVSFFMSARAEYGTVVWTEDIDIAPEHLYECSEQIF